MVALIILQQQQQQRRRRQGVLWAVTALVTLTTQSSQAFSIVSTSRRLSVARAATTGKTISTSSWSKQPKIPTTTTRLYQTLPECPGEENDNDATLAVSSLQKALDAGDLRQAVACLQQQVQVEDVTLSRSAWSQIFDLIEERTTNAEENTENLTAAAASAAVEFPAISAARSEMTDMYNALRRKGHLRLYGALDNTHGQPLLAAGSNQIPPSLLEGILDLPMKALTPQPTNSLLYAGAAVAILEGLTSMVAGIPMSTLVLLTLFVITCDRLFLSGAAFESFLKVFSPGVQEKILRHEAGHFLAAYLLGCPVEGIVLSAWAALKDKRFGGRSVSAGTSFFDPQLSEQINTRQSVTQSAVDRYSIIVMAGIAAEADGYGRADGGAGDEMSLVAFLSQLNSNNGRRGSTAATTVWNNDSIRNQARWGALQAVLMLREYKPAYEALVDALERGGTLGDCIFAIEQAARQHNLQPSPPSLGYIVEEPLPEGGGKRVVWKKVGQPLASGAGGAATSSSSSSVASLSSSASEQQNAEHDAVNKEETMSTALQQYRAQVEAQLRRVEQELQELEEKR